MRIFCFSFTIILFYSCTNPKSNNTENKATVNSVKKDTSFLTKECIQIDTITATGTKIHYINRKGQFQISWGNDSYQRSSDSLYECFYDETGEVWDFVPKYYSETKNYLVFERLSWTSSGGNPAPLEYSAIVFPKNMKDSICEKEFFIDCIDGILLYGDSDNENLHLLNIETKKSQLILLSPKPYTSRSPTLSIRQTKIEKKVLFIKYESLDKEDETVINKKTFKIKI